jgi:hypothetical protein
LKNLTTAVIPELALASLLLFALPAYATPTTVTFHDATASMFVTPMTCPDGSVIPGGTLSFTFNGVAHFNTDSNGGMHFTSTTTASFTLTSTTNGIDYAGHLTTWDGGTAHLTSTGASEFGFTLSVHATGTDGSKFAFHQDAQFTVNAQGIVTVNIFNLKC